ncbi:MAG: hypothetical protein B6I28_05325 [Fusobacteriia bacterium 4572_132]|nr:MAG: hypothetical protein B6I28_05325 [Fusobacteriia bacterium 4572_132]
MTATDEILYNEEKGFASYTALKQRLNINSSNKEFSLMRGTILKLKPFSLEELTKLSEKIIEIYSRVYPLELKTTPDSIKNWVLLEFNKNKVDIEKLSVRIFIIKLIEILDIISTDPNNNIFKTRLELSKSNGKYIFKNKL